MSDCGPIDEVRSFLARRDHILGQPIGGVVPHHDSLPSWYSKEDFLRSRHAVHFSFLKELPRGYGTYHPQTDSQIEQVNQILEDLLHVRVLTYGKRWDLCLPFVEFSYNNSFQASIKMSPYEALDGRRC
jgi:hypothetical protein